MPSDRGPDCVRSVCVFDAYGTLFDVDGAARAVGLEAGQERFAAHWQRVSARWRDKQLQYSWLRTIMGLHADFWQVTRDGLDWALEAEGLDGDQGLRERLLALYRVLPPYPEAAAMLDRLRAMGCRTAILSNGSPEMLAAAVTSARLEQRLDAVLSVEQAGRFKPAAGVYDLVGRHFGCTPEAVLFVSANGWDAAGASGYGFTTVWVNRNGHPVDRLPHRPRHQVTDLQRIPEFVRG